MVMRISNSPLQDLLQARPDLRSQRYFKSSLTALSHAIEDLALTGVDKPLIIANFQQERFYRQEIRRYWEIAQHTDQVYVLAAAESDFAASETNYEIISFHQSDRLAKEWHLVVLGQQYAACIVCQEYMTPDAPPLIDQARQFEGIWTFDRQVSYQVAQLLLAQILRYRPDLARKVEQAKARFGLSNQITNPVSNRNQISIDPGTFTERLVTYLQANQNQLLKAYRTIASQERQARLANSITDAIRRSLNLPEILTTAVTELGRAFAQCRCLLYRCDRIFQSVTIEYEAVAPAMTSLKGETWLLVENPLFQAAIATEKAIAVTDITKPNLQNPTLKALLQRAGIRAWLLVPIMYQETLLGMLEIHYTGDEPYTWQKEDISLVEAIAAQVGIALIQAQAYSRLEDLNSQLAALERTRTNLIAIVGHELRTPLSTIQICLETLADEPQMSLEMQQVMLQTALTDAERLRKLTEDFLMLSRLETGQVHWQFEPISLRECLDLALNSLRSTWSRATLAKIEVNLPPQVPLILSDGEGLAQVLTKLLDNALKFAPEEKVTIAARIVTTSTAIEVCIADSGRGIEPTQLKAIFARFSQQEGYLRRLTSGTGLGLAICQQIIQGLGGQIWAESLGKNQGSQFYFRLPLGD